ncbi:MAG: hypothetical protein JO250_17080 [Armatimonadetes bacterium]|nr:hypothetical protein [Armatimonadota bacterium]
MPPRRVAGVVAQGPFTLLAVTRASPAGFLTPPPAALPPPRGAFNVPVMAVGSGTGIWIGVRGGIGFKTLRFPADGLRHQYPFGDAMLVVDESHTQGYSIGWYGRDGVSLLPEWKHPYAAQGGPALTSAGRTIRFTVSLIPVHLSRWFQVTAQPLSASGHPLSRPVSLVCQPVSPTTLFAQIPDGYNAATRQFRVTIKTINRPGGATWQLAGLPTSVRNGPDRLPPIVAVGYGPMAIRAAAAEAEDFSGYPDFFNRHPDRDAGGGWAFTGLASLDQHGWTGVPTIRVLLTYDNTSPDFWNQNWLIDLNRVIPQWGVTTSNAARGSPLASLPAYNPQNLTPGTTWLARDWEAGVAYPGQQHWIRIEGAMLRSAFRTETVTFHDAEIVRDAASGGDRVVWRHPETQTTPSGITLTVLNARPGVSDTPASPSGNPPWRFNDGSAELLLAWHLPPGIVSQEHAALNAPREAQGLETVGALKSEWDISRPLAWSALSVPGESDTQALARGGSTPVRLSITSSAPPILRAPLHEGLNALYPAPLPSHLKTITVQVTLREQQERHPFRLLVPVRASFPPGWNPDVADSRFRFR